MSATSSSPGVMPVFASTRKSTRSASSTARRACSAISRVSGVGSTMSTPPVSTIRNRFPPHSHTTSLRSRVTPGVSKTTASRVAVRRLTRVDLPTFGNPTTATTPRSGASVTLGDLGRSLLAPRGRPGRPAQLVHAHEPLPQAADLRLDLGRRRGVPLRVARVSGEAHRLAEGDRDRVTVALRPELRAVDGGRQDRYALLDGEHRRAGHRLPRHAAHLTGALDEEPEELVLPDGRAHLPEGLAVGFAPPEGDRSVETDELRETGHLEELGLRHEHDAARAHGSEGGRVDVGEMVHGEDAAALARYPLLAVRLQRYEGVRDGAQQALADHP